MRVQPHGMPWGIVSFYIFLWNYRKDLRSWWRCRGLSSCCYSCCENYCIFTFFLPESDSWMIAISSETARERAQSENGHLLNLRLQEATINAAHTIRDSFKPAWFAWFQVSGQTVLSGISMGASRATKSCPVSCVSRWRFKVNFWAKLLWHTEQQSESCELLVVGPSMVLYSWDKTSCF